MKELLVKTLVVVFVAAMVFNVAGNAYANDTVRDMGHKLYRGIANAATGWVELPKAVYDESKAHDPATGLLWGSMKGSVDAVKRTSAGVYDGGTFLFPIPKDYAPVLEPELLF